MEADPALSVVIATHRRPLQLERCLNSLAEQDLSRDRWEVIVVHDGGDAPPAGCRGEIAIRQLQTCHLGCGLARNAGAAAARGRCLIFTDDDCTFPPDLLSRYEEAFRANPECLIAGSAKNWLAENAYAQATHAMTELLLRFSNRAENQNNMAIGNNMGVPSVEFRRLGGFSARYFRNAAEDRDFSARWLAAGKRIVFEPGIVVHHAHQMNLRGFLRQHYHYGRGAYVFHRSQAERHQRKWQAPGFYAAMIVRAPTARARMLLALSQLAHTVGFARGFIASKMSRRDAPEQWPPGPDSNRED